MNYSINPMELTSIFAVPSSVVDDHIKLASEYQLKVLLLFIRNQTNADVFDVISKKLNLEQKEVKECLDYWAQRGVLINNDNDSTVAVKIKNENKKESITTSKPTREEAVERIASSEELQYLATVAQEKLSRPITASEYRTFVWLFDQYGLPVPVIIQAIQFAVDEGKTNFSYIEKTCIDWANNEINTLAKVEDRLNAVYLSKTAWKIVESAFGIAHRRASANETKYAQRWVNEYEFNKDMLTAAYNLCVDSTSKVNFKYINTVLTNWHKKDYKKPDDIKNDKLETKKEKVTVSYSKSKIKNKLNNFD